jgi:hypothetical protein
MYRTNRHTVKNDFEREELQQLERTVIEAHYLGLTLRRWGRRRNFTLNLSTAFVGELLIGWARLVGRTLTEDEPIQLPANGLHCRAFRKA